MAASKPKSPSAAPAPVELQLLVLSGGMTGPDLAATLEALKDKSKSASTHKRRELYWNAYGEMIKKATSMEGPAFCFLAFKATADGEDGALEVVELTKRQRGLLCSVEFLGHKFKPLVDGKPDPKAKTWALAFSEEDAAAAWEDINSGEPCISITADGVYVGTRFKRVQCKGLSGLPKSGKDVEALVAELAPDKPLRSVSFAGNEPPSVNGYNVVLAGPSKLEKELPATVGYAPSNSNNEIYSCFVQRKNAYVVGQAEKLLAQMLIDSNKGLQPIIETGQKNCGIAYKNALMRKVYAHESMKKFIDRVRADGAVELHVVRGDVDPECDFAKYGSLVFELFYRCDLATFG